MNQSVNKQEVFVVLDLDRTLFDTVHYGEQVAAGDEAIDAEAVRIDGASRLIDELIRRQLPFGILTHGEFDLQHAKLRAAQLADVPYLITDTIRKAELMRQWRHPEGGFIIPAELAGEPLHVQRIVLLDDKAAAFDNLTDGVDGFLFRRDGWPVLEQQAGEIPAEVQTIHSLDELLYHL